MNLQLAVKGEYFDQIKAGTKTRENRLRNDYWKKRLSKGPFDTVTITRGYPKRTDTDKILVFPWRGFDVVTIRHKHFGPEPVEVFAIILGETK